MEGGDAGSVGDGVGGAAPVVPVAADAAYETRRSALENLMKAYLELEKEGKVRSLRAALPGRRSS